MPLIDVVLDSQIDQLIHDNHGVGPVAID